MRELVEDLCSDRCAGRAAGTAGGRLARGIVARALRDAGLDLVSLARGEPGLIVRPADAEVIPPLSDYLGFWDRPQLAQLVARIESGLA